MNEKFIYLTLRLIECILKLIVQLLNFNNYEKEKKQKKSR